MNVTSPRTVLAGALLGACLVLPRGAPAEVEVTSIADWSCADWAARRGGEGRVDPPQMWLSGFMSALAAAYRTNVLALVDAETLFARMDGYCAEHPAEQVSTGAQWLFRDLLQALPKGPPRLL